MNDGICLCIQILFPRLVSQRQTLCYYLLLLQVGCQVLAYKACGAGDDGFHKYSNIETTIFLLMVDRLNLLINASLLNRLYSKFFNCVTKSSTSQGLNNILFSICSSTKEFA